MIKNVQNDQKWPKMIKNDQKWPKMTKNDQKWPKWPKWPNEQNDQNDQKWPKITKKDRNYRTASDEVWSMKSGLKSNSLIHEICNSLWFFRAIKFIRLSFANTVIVVVKVEGIKVGQKRKRFKTRCRSLEYENRKKMAFFDPNDP